MESNTKSLAQGTGRYLPGSHCCRPHLRNRDLSRSRTPRRFLPGSSLPPHRLRAESQHLT